MVDGFRVSLFGFRGGMFGLVVLVIVIVRRDYEYEYD